MEEVFRHYPDRELSSRDVILYTHDLMGEATVYRLLKKMTEDGILQRSQNKDGISTYRLTDDGCGCRFHLHCVSCGRVFHMDCDAMKDAERHIMAEHGFLPAEKTTVIEGMCGVCRGKASHQK